MNKKIYKMLVLDLDGTLLNSNKKITTKTKNKLIEIQEKGIKVVLSSGRPTKGMEEIALLLQLDKYGSYISSFNGASVIKMDTNETLVDESITKEDIHCIYDLAKKHNVSIITYLKDRIVTEKTTDFILKISNSLKMEIELVESFKDYVNFSSGKCLLMANENHIAKVLPLMQKEYGHKYTILTSHPSYIEVTKKGVNKEKSLKHLIEKIGVKKEEVIAVGDGFNDLSMIEFAGLGVAMANAEDEIKAKANYVTIKSNEEDGVVEVIEKFIM